MINKNRPITLAAKMAKDHSGADILVTMTLMPFTTTPYKVDVQWSDKEMSVYVDRFPVTVAFHTEDKARECFVNANSLGCNEWDKGGCIHDWHGHGKGPKYADGYGYHAPEEKASSLKGMPAEKWAAIRETEQAEGMAKMAKIAKEPLPWYTVIATKTPEETLRWSPRSLQEATKETLEAFPWNETHGHISRFVKNLRQIEGMLEGWRYGDGDMEMAFMTLYRMFIDTTDTEAEQWAKVTMSRIVDF